MRDQDVVRRSRGILRPLFDYVLATTACCSRLQVMGCSMRPQSIDRGNNKPSPLGSDIRQYFNLGPAG